MKRYFIWKDANCNGIDPEWLEVKSDEFNRITAEHPERKFIPSYDEEDPEDDWFIYEATAESYKEWNRARMRYIRQSKQFYDKYMVVNLDELIDEEDEEGLTWAEIIPDTREEDAAAHEAWLNWREKAVAIIPEILIELKPQEIEIIKLVFLNNPEKKSEKTIAKEINVPQQTLNYRKNAILKKMKKILIKKLGRNENRVQ